MCQILMHDINIFHQSVFSYYFFYFLMALNFNLFLEST